MKIERRMVHSLALLYRDYLCTNDSHVSMSEWINGEGHDVVFTTPNHIQSISLSYADLDALIALYSGSRISEPGDE